MYRLLMTFAASVAVGSLPIAALADAFPDRHASGLIWWVDRGAITLRTHRTIFLKHGTQIEPRGARLEPGQHIVVQGEDAANGNLDASAIRILGKHVASTRGYGNWYGGRDDVVVNRPSEIPQSHGRQAHAARAQQLKRDRAHR